MVLIPKQNLVEMAVELGEVKSLPRPYLGYSSIGHPCTRYLWYTFRWCYEKTYSKRVQRIFDHGDWEEQNVIRDLRLANIGVGRLQQEVVGPAYHVRGHIDGCCTNVPGAEKTEHLLEVKTANDSRYKSYIKIPLDAKGHANERLRQWDEGYYSQVNSYMGKLGLKRCLFVVVNKNTEHRTYDRIHFDNIQFEVSEERALHVLLSETPPFKIGENPAWFQCKFCDAKNICHFKAEPLRNCRTCEHSCIEDNGYWSCDLHNKRIWSSHLLVIESNPLIQEKGCDQYIKMKCL